MTRRTPVDGLLDTLAEGLRGDDDNAGATFMRGLTLGALIGAAIAGSVLWQRRVRRWRAGPGAIDEGRASASAPEPGGTVPVRRSWR